MFETRNDVICCSAGCRGGKAWHGGGVAGSQAISTFPRHPAHQAAVVRSGAKSRTVSRVRPVRDRTRAAHTLGVSAAIVARRDQWLCADAAGDLSSSSWMASDVSAGVASGAALMSMLCPVPGGIAVPIRWRLWACVPSRRTPPGKPAQGGRAFRGGAKRGASNERTGGVARRRTILAKTKGCADCPAMKGRLPWCRITPDNE